MNKSIKIGLSVVCGGFFALKAVTVDQEAFVAALKRGDANAAQIVLNRPGFSINFPEAQSLLGTFISGNNISGKTMGEFLITHGIDVNFDMNGNSDSPLIVAAAQGDRNMVFNLLQHGAQINHQNKKGLTALMASIEANRNGDRWKVGDQAYNALATTKLLIDKGANIQLVDRLGKTAHDYALNKPEILKLLKKLTGDTKDIEDFLNQAQTIDFLRSPDGAAYLKRIAVL